MVATPTRTPTPIHPQPETFGVESIPSKRVRITFNGNYKKMEVKYKGLRIEVTLRRPKANGFDENEVMNAIAEAIAKKLEAIVNTLRLATFADSIAISVSGVYGKDYG